MRTINHYSKLSQFDWTFHFLSFGNCKGKSQKLSKKKKNIQTMDAKMKEGFGFQHFLLMLRSYVYRFSAFLADI